MQIKIGCQLHYKIRLRNITNKTLAVKRVFIFIFSLYLNLLSTVINNYIFMKFLLLCSKVMIYYIIVKNVHDLTGVPKYRISSKNSSGKVKWNFSPRENMTNL